MRWQHVDLRSCKLELGSGRSIVHIDDEGFVSDIDEYGEHALLQWAEQIGFQRVPCVVVVPDEAVSSGDIETIQPPKRTTRKKRAPKTK